MHLSELQQLALWTVCVQIVVISHRTEGLQCFVCHGKTHHGCTNAQLKAGHTKAMYSQTCAGEEALCVKITTEVSKYQEDIFSISALKKYFKSMEAFDKCSGFTGGKGATTKAAEVGGGGVATTAASVIGGTAAADGGAAGGNATAEATTAPPAAMLAHYDHVPPHTHSGNASEGLSPGGVKRCPAALPFPDPTGSVERYDTRVSYYCGNRSDYAKIAVVNRCRRMADKVVNQITCTCSTDLCNTASLAMPAAFVLLILALLHLHLTVG